MSSIKDRTTAGLECAFCTPVSRRDFVRTIGAGALASAVPIIGGTTTARAATARVPVQAGPTPKSTAETAVARFYKSMTPEQRKILAFPFDDPLRKRVGNNWAIVKPSISELTPEQQSICREIMKNLCSEDGYERFMKQMDDDDGGFEAYHVAVFGEPGTDKPFEWVLSGRHDTLAGRWQQRGRGRLWRADLLRPRGRWARYRGFQAHE